jgi:uncharacterized protein YfaT (DUF1175 family)
VVGVTFVLSGAGKSSALVDSDSDGMPDAIELDTAQDEQAFRRWFTFLAEAQFFQEPSERPTEIKDCAALIRYAYREALRTHDSAWANGARLPILLALPSVEKYQYPHTAIGASLFRVKDGRYSQFADAQTLQRFNSHFISRNLDRALPGDLLFYRHESTDMPFHGIIYLGESQLQRDAARYVVYHTGPDADHPGEIRRPSIEELMHHPNPQWRPLAGNPTFLGVYRWNILP